MFMKTLSLAKSAYGLSLNSNDFMRGQKNVWKA